MLLHDHAMLTIPVASISPAACKHAWQPTDNADNAYQYIIALRLDVSSASAAVNSNARAFWQHADAMQTQRLGNRREEGVGEGGWGQLGRFCDDLSTMADFDAQQNQQVIGVLYKVAVWAVAN